MRYAAILILLLALAAATTAQDLGTQAPVKTSQSYPESIPNPLCQGGETIASATYIPALPYYDSGTTAGHIDDYDEVCPYTGATAPDVVYKYTSPYAQAITVDLCGSNYDTKLYVYDSGLNMIACNDDYYFAAPCGVYVSKLENVFLSAGQTYYIIVDGYNTASGTYLLNVEPWVCCYIECPADGDDEGEPPLVNEYVDNFNGGCNTPGYPFQAVQGDPAGERILCGVAGWYLSAGSNFRDTDWFILTPGSTGAIAITADAEYATYIFELGPQDCGAVSVIQQATIGPSAPGSLTISGYAPGAPVWFWVGSTIFVDPDSGNSEYDYVVWFTGLEPVVSLETTTWSAVKALYD